MLMYSFSSMTNAFNIHLRPCLCYLILLLPCLFLLLVCFWCCRSGIDAGFRFGLGLGRCYWLLHTQPGPRGLGLLPAWAAAERTKELSLPKQPAPAHSHCTIHGTMKYRLVLSLVSGQDWPAFASLNIQVHVPACGEAASRTFEPRAKPGIARGSACYVGRLASWTPVEYQRGVHATPSHSPPALRERERERGLQEIASVGSAVTDEEEGEVGKTAEEQKADGCEGNGGKRPYEGVEE
ncbi:uncharacterized protein LOC113541778 isoform X1 [Tachysurus ichikawai]